MSIISPEVLDFKKDILPLQGKLRYPLTNDYLFTSAFQHNTYALKGFLSAKLNLDPDVILSLEIMNPKEPGANIDDKDIILDVKARINGDKIITVEMQLTHYDYLPERFLFQLCRIYSGCLPKGEAYNLLPPVIHIAILDCDLFPKGDPRNTEDFLSEYYLTETKRHHIYSGNFRMEVVSLKNIENAVDKTDPNGVYQWAKLFTATTWKEFNMIAENNSYMESMAASICTLCNDPKFVAECERRFLNELEYNSRMEEADRKGMERGMEQGLEQGMAAGKIEGKLESILQLLGELGEIPDEISHKITSTKEEEILQKWLKIAARAESISEFCQKTELE